MGLAGADKNQVAFAHNRFVIALPSPARVVESRLHMRPAEEKATKLASRTQQETFSGPVWKARPAESSRQIGWPVSACLRPEAVALPRNVGGRFPALPSSEVASQRCHGMQLRVREIRLWSQQRKLLRDRCHCFHQTSPCQLRLLSILRQ